jgi:hypothetical protein
MLAGGVPSLAVDVAAAVRATARGRLCRVTILV